MSIQESFSSKAWLLDGPLHSVPGILHLESGRLSYIILEQGTFSQDRLSGLLQKNSVVDSGNEPEFPIQLFSIPREIITRFRIPWYYFGAGGHLFIGDRTFPFSFVRPQNTVEPSYYSEAFMQWRGGEGQEEVNILEGKASGKRWKQLLAR